MADPAFPSTTTHGCPGPPNEEIPITPFELPIPSVPDPHVEGDLFSIPFPLALPAIGCASMGVSLVLTSDDSVLTGSGEFVPRDLGGGQVDPCDVDLLLEINVPPAVLPPFCGPDNTGFTLNTLVGQGSEYGLSGGWTQSPDSCLFELDLDFSFACPEFTADSLNVTHDRAWEDSFTMSVSQVADPGAPDSCDFQFDIDLNLPCTVPRIGVIARYDSDLTEPYATMSVITPPGSLATPLTFDGIVDFDSVLDTKFAVRLDGDFAGGLEFEPTGFPPNYFHGCFVQFTSGPAAGPTKYAIQSWEQYPNGGLQGGFVLWTALPALPEEDDTFTVTCGGAEAATVDDALPVSECDKLWALDIRLPTPPSITDLENKAAIIGSVSGLGSSGEEIAGSTEYTVMLPDGAIITALNAAALTYSPNLLHGPVPNGTSVFIFEDFTFDTVHWFYHYVDPEDEACTAVSRAILSAPNVARVRLWAYPAGQIRCDLEAPETVYEIVCPDLNGLGWLPVSALSPTLQLQGPYGAKFWYNIPIHLDLTGEDPFADIFPYAVETYPRRLYIEVDGTIPGQGVQATLTVPTGVWDYDEDPLVIMNRYGLWWMKDTYGNVPWSDSLALSQCVADMNGCSYTDVYDPYAYALLHSKRIILNLTYDQGSILP